MSEPSAAVGYSPPPLSITSDLCFLVLCYDVSLWISLNTVFLIILILITNRNTEILTVNNLLTFSVSSEQTFFESCCVDILDQIIRCHWGLSCAF